MTDRVAEILKGFSVTAETTVAWGDMDSFKHVNNVVFFRYIENARVVYGTRIDITERMETEGVGPILAWADCKYIRPVKFPDTIHIGVRLTRLEGSEMMLEYKLVSGAQEAVAAVANSLGVYYDYQNLKRVDFPAELIARMEAVEGCSAAEINKRREG